VLIATSGTTGHPQLVTLSHRAVMHRWWPGNPSTQTDTSYLGWAPLDHVMGLGMAAPNYQRKVYLPAEVFVRDPARWLECIERYGITHSNMTNFGMKLLCDAISSERYWNLTSLQKIGVGAEMISPQICTEFTHKIMRFGAPQDVVIIGYGLSECGPVAGGQRSFIRREDQSDTAPLLIDQPTRGHGIRVVDKNGHTCEALQIGHIEVCGPTMTSGYYKDDGANKQLFTSDGWLRTGDLGYLDDETLCVTGREKETISINAKKLSCHEIDAVIGTIEGIELAHVFNVEERTAFVYGAAAQNAELEQKIRATCAQKFGFGPAHCIYVTPEQLPRTRSGKLQRHMLCKLLPENAAPSSMPDARNISLEMRLQMIMASQLAGVVPEAQDDFFELGGDSLGALIFTVTVEKELNVNLPPGIFASNPSCKAVAEYLHSDASRAGKLALVSVLHGSGPLRLFLTPGIWGNNAYAAQLASDLGPEISVDTFHLTAPEQREQQMETMGSFAEECCRSIREVQPHGPYHLGGHSFGGLLAYEMARQLISKGETIGSLSIIDTTAKLDERSFGAAETQQRPAFINQYYNHLRKHYLPEPADCFISYYRAKDSPHLPCSDPTGGWSSLAREGVEIFDIPGGHGSVVRGRSRAQIASLIRAAMHGQRSEGTTPPVPIDTDSWQLIQRARQAALRGELNAEITLWSQALTMQPELPYWVYANLTEALFAARRIPEALNAYQQALNIDPWKLTSYKRFAVALRTHGLLAQIREALVHISGIEVHNVATAFAKAKIYGEFGQAADAVHNLKLGLELVPASIELRWMLANVHAQLQHPLDAAREIRQALLHPADNDIMLLRLGKLALKIREEDLAVECLQRVLAINPRAPGAYELLGKIHENKGSAQAANEHKEKALSAMRGLRFEDPAGP